MFCPQIVNSKGYDFNAFIDPDENYIIFSSYKRPDDLGGGDLYYSLNRKWLLPVHFERKSILPRLFTLRIR
jgi:hypothetical protein